MKILAIETSCDETGISVIDASGSFENFKCSVLADELLSQASLHAEYGGVFPNLAKREHSRNLVPLLKKVLGINYGIFNFQPACAGRFLIFKQLPKSKTEKIKEILGREPELAKQLLKFLRNTKKPEVDAIAVTYGPGLAPALWVGVNFARALSIAWSIPIVPVNHMEGHVFSALLRTENNFQFSTCLRRQVFNFQFPAVALLISGGHTQLVLMRDWFKYELLGETRDDAVGEAFDKVARLLGLPYPGGPEISKLAEEARSSKLEPLSSKLPRPMIDTDDYDFSFAGLKTAVLTLTKKLGELSEVQKKQIAREFEDATADVLLQKVARALAETGAKTLILGGGVAANSHINKRIAEALKDEFREVEMFTPARGLTGDNALMIAVAGYFRTLSGEYVAQEDLVAEANLTLHNL